MTVLADYERRVSEAIDDFLLHRENAGYFRYVQRILTAPSEVFPAGMIPDKTSRELVTHDAWWRLLRSFDNKASTSENVQQSMLAGLLQGQRWMSCLEKIDDAYALTALIARSLARAGTWHSKFPEAYLMRDDILMDCLNAWASPGAGINYDSSSFAEAMFGDAWLALMVDHPGDLAEAIESMRPPFMPGVLPAQKEQRCEMLPDLDGPM